MNHELRLNNPWFVAVWPGMGHVAISAGFYLIAKLGMSLHREVSPEGLFDVDHVEVVDGIIQATELPRNRYFVYRDAHGKRDGVVFIGEAQPSVGKYAFCNEIISFAKELGVTEITTFAAMATHMRPEHQSRVFAAATDELTLDSFIQLDAEVLKDGNISGLNGVLLGAAAASHLHGSCFLGEMPSIFHQFPYPKASLNVLRIFCQSVGLTLDFEELEEQATTMDEQLSKWLRRLERSMQQREGEVRPEDANFEEHAASLDEAEEDFEVGSVSSAVESNLLSNQERERIESLFNAASTDRSKAYELKRELDRLQVFKQYENRFLDLFRQPPPLDSAA